MFPPFNFDQIRVLITSGCNLNCTHCYQHFEKNKFILPMSKLIEIVDFAVQHSTKTLVFSGGEFFTHPFAYRLLEYCLSKRIGISIITNATDLDLSFFEKCHDLDLLSMQVSIDGMKKNHDLRRGYGAYDATINNVSRLKKLGIPITASITLDEHNYTDAIEVLNIPYFTSFNLLPVAFAGAARMHGSTNTHTNSIRDYENVMRIVYKKTASSVDKNNHNQIFPHELAIKYDGGVYPCAIAQDYGILCMGNITNRSLHDTIQDYIRSENARILSEYTSNDIPECNNCLSKGICDRGCRVRAYKFHGKFLAPDPFCCKVFNNDFEDIPMNRLFWGEK